MAEEVTFTISAVNRASTVIKTVAADVRTMCRRVRTELNSVSSWASGWAGRLGGLLSRPFRLALGAVRTWGRLAGYAVVGGLGAITAGVIKTTAEFQTLQTRMQTLFGTDWQRMWAWSMEMARETPYDLRGVIDVVARLRAYGLDATESFRTLGDAAAAVGGGEALSRITYAIGQMNAATRVHAQDMRQLTELGLPAWDLLARGIGKTTAEAMDLASQGLIPASQAIPILLRGFEQMFGGQMARQLNTLQGRWSNLIDAVSRMFWGLGQRIGPYIQAIVGGLTAAIERISTSAAIDKLANWLTNILSPARVRVFVTFFANLKRWAADVWKYLTDAGRLAFETLARSATALIRVLGGNQGLWGVLKRVAMAWLAWKGAMATFALIEGAPRAWQALNTFLRETRFPQFPAFGQGVEYRSELGEAFMQGFNQALAEALSADRQTQARQQQTLEQIQNNTGQMVDAQERLLQTIYGGGPRAKWLSARFGGGGGAWGVYIPRTARLS